MITFCIPSKNNLRYLKVCIPSIQRNSSYDNEILVYVDKNDDRTTDWLDEIGVKYVLNSDQDCKGIGHAYDTLFKLAKNDLVIAFHADMILGLEADKNLVKHHQRNRVVCSTRIEPPLHPPGQEKIVRDFGMWPEEIKWKEFDEFVKECLVIYKDKVTGSSFAPWLIDRRDHLGHDPIFLSVFEDADLFRRFVLAGYTMIQSWDSLVYHLTCRGGQFLGAEKMEDFNKKDELWLKNNQLSMLEYIRKWGGYFKEWGPCEPRPNKKYDVGLKAINCNIDVLNLEPFFSNLEVDVNYNEYVKSVQPNSKFDIRSKFVSTLANDIIVNVDFAKISANQLQQIMMNIEELLEDAEQNTAYEILGINIIVKNKTQLQIKTRI